MTTDISNITAVHWQPALGSFGEIVEGLDDVNQTIGIIVTTPLGMAAELQRVALFINIIDLHQQTYSGEYGYMHDRGNAHRDLMAPKV